MNQKESAVTFLKMAGSGDVRAAYDKFTAANSIHHNQYFKGDRESLMKAMEEAHNKSPNKGDYTMNRTFLLWEEADISKLG